MAVFLLAQQTSDNDAGGALLTLWFLLGLFIIVAAVLWVLYSRPHRRVPPRPPVRAHGASSTATAVQPGPPKPGPADSGGRR